MLTITVGADPRVRPVYINVCGHVAYIRATARVAPTVMDNVDGYSMTYLYRKPGKGICLNLLGL